jgi:hypothetical protein
MLKTVSPALAGVALLLPALLHGQWHGEVGSGIAHYPAWLGGEMTTGLNLNLHLKYRQTTLINFSNQRLTLRQNMGRFGDDNTVSLLFVGIMGRYADMDDRLAATDNQPHSLEWGSGFSGEFGPLPFQLQILRNSRDGGLRLNGTLYSGFRLNPNSGLFFIPSLEWGDATTQRRYFGVTANEAYRSGLPPYQPNEGDLLNARLLLAAIHRLNASWRLTLYVALDHIGDMGAASPVAGRQDNVTVALGFAWQIAGRFRYPWEG